LTYSWEAAVIHFRADFGTHAFEKMCFRSTETPVVIGDRGAATDAIPDSMLAPFVAARAFALRSGEYASAVRMAKKPCKSLY
jgi:hypothetical protein